MLTAPDAPTAVGKEPWSSGRSFPLGERSAVLNLHSLRAAVQLLPPSELGSPIGQKTAEFCVFFSSWCD